MSDLEGFSGGEGGGEISKEALEKFREQMRKNAKAIKKQQKSEGKQKKKEDQLAKILAHFIQNGQDPILLQLVIEVLRQNVPGYFVLSLIALGDPNIRTALSQNQMDGEDKEEVWKGHNPVVNISNELSDDLPDVIKKDLDLWTLDILDSGAVLPRRIIETILTPENKIKAVIMRLMVYVLNKYLEGKHDVNERQCRQFCGLLIKKVIQEVKIAAQNERMVSEENLSEELI